MSNIGSITVDLDRFSKLHSWFTHLSFEGDDYLLFPWKGQQPKTPFDPQIEDAAGIHWWAWDSRDIDEIPIDGVGKDIIMRHPVKFNCCLRGVEVSADGSSFIEGFSVIERHEPEFEAQIRARYPGLMSLERMFEYESLKQKKSAEKTAHLIKLMFEEKCPWWLTMGPERDDYLRSSGGDVERAAMYCGSPPSGRKKKKLRRGVSGLELRRK
jgi:hypothetical protein